MWRGVQEIEESNDEWPNFGCLWPKVASYNYCMGCQSSRYWSSAFAHNRRCQAPSSIFVSRSSTPAEQNYSQIDCEALAVIFALDKFHIYVYGRKFTLITDNRPLTRIFHRHAKLPLITASRLLQYAAYPTSFNYEVQHRPNEKHINVDYLFRFPLSDTEPSANFQ